MLSGRLPSPVTPRGAKGNCKDAAPSPVVSPPVFSGAGNLNLNSIDVWEVQPVSFSSGLQSSSLQLLLASIRIVTPDGVAIVVEAGVLTFEQGQEEVVTAAEEA